MSPEEGKYRGCDSDVRTGHIRLVNHAYGQLAMLAYHGFINEGPGMVVISNYEYAEINGEPVSAGLLAEYVSRDDSRLAPLLGPKEKGWLDTYNAQTTVLIMFLYESKKMTSSYRIASVGKLSPQQFWTKHHKRPR